MYKSNMAENHAKQTVWKCRLDQYPWMILNPKSEFLYSETFQILKNLVSLTVSPISFLLSMEISIVAILKETAHEFVKFREISVNFVHGEIR